MQNHFAYADKIFKNAQSISGEFLGGFNSRLLGDGYSDACGYPHYADPQRSAGWWRADKMIADGYVYYHHTFPHKGCRGLSINYGGSQCCNSCGQRGLAKSWWIIRVFADGAARCCVGEGFSNLQEANNFAFGDTRAAAIDNYEKLMTAPDATGGE